MTKEVSILLIGLISGALIYKLFLEPPATDTHIHDVNSLQSKGTPLVALPHLNQASTTPIAESIKQTTQQDLLSSHVNQPLAPDRAALDVYNADTLQLSRIKDNLQWVQSFQGNYSVEANTTNDALTKLANSYANDFGFVHESGCNAQFCALLAQGFTDKAQAEEVLDKMTKSAQMPSFKLYQIIESGQGVALRFSIPINKDYQPTAAEISAFSKWR